MQVHKLAVTGAVALASFTALSLSAPAYALCESYSGGCPTTPPSGGGGGVEEQPVTGTDEQPVTGTDEQPVPGTDQPVGGVDEQPTDSGTNGGNPGGAPVRGDSGGPGVDATPSTLPFTGGELVLLTAVGAGALAGGTALVIAGRRRTATA